MILIDGVEIITIEDGLTFNGAKDTVTRSLSFSFLYNPMREDIPRYKVAINSKVEWIEENKTLFLGFVESVDYSTDSDNISVNCVDFASRLMRSKCVGRFYGTLTELVNKICASFNIKNGISNSTTQKHNIVSTGDKTYYEILQTACKTLYDSFTLYMDSNTLKLQLPTKKPIATFEIGKNIRASSFSQSMSEMVNKVIMIDNDGNVYGSVENKADLSKYGLFQDVYNYNTDISNNVEEARKQLKSVQNNGSIVANNDNNCISGQYIKFIEPVNGFEGIFEILTDSHTIGSDSVMTLELNNVG
jgi:hypothetical protein